MISLKALHLQNMTPLVESHPYLLIIQATYSFIHSVNLKVNSFYESSHDFHKSSALDILDCLGFRPKILYLFGISYMRLSLGIEHCS